MNSTNQASLPDVIDFLNKSLCIDEFTDTALNGLQVEGLPSITKVAAAVDVSIATVEAAQKIGANILLVHHGLIWDKPFAIIGNKLRLLNLLLNNGISLYAAHLPLDAHPQYGNNIALAKELEIEAAKPCFEYTGHLIGVKGINPSRLTLRDYFERLSKLPGGSANMLALPFGPDIPSKVGVVSGAGAFALHECKNNGVDTLITGEPRHFAYHFAREEQLNVLFGGHYVTETLGIQEISRAVHQHFGISWEFIDIPTGM